MVPLSTTHSAQQLMFCKSDNGGASVGGGFAANNTISEKHIYTGKKQADDA